MIDRLKFLFNRMRERLWVRPLAMCVLSVAAALASKAVDLLEIGKFIPAIAPESIKTLLSILSASMLVIATFAVASMVSAYASASRTATPRSFSLVISDDVSQNALSTFIGAFIFSIVALIALENSYYAKSGRFALFILTLVVFAVVILTFVRWMDRIARLGRLGNTIHKVEHATLAAMRQRRPSPPPGGVPAKHRFESPKAVFGHSIGYVQRVDLAEIQAFAEDSQTEVDVAALPGTFAAPGRALAYVNMTSGIPPDIDVSRLQNAFHLGRNRTFDEDPRFGLIVLSEIASRALSPAVNDPGTAIDVIGTMVRLFAVWAEPSKDDCSSPALDRVAIPDLSLHDMFDDAFGAIARDGAGIVEVMVKLQKAFHALSSIQHPAMNDVAMEHARSVLARAETVLEFPTDLERVRQASRFAADA